MRIVIDLQGAQSTGSRNRGIGRYSLALAQGLLRQAGEHEVVIALSDQFFDTIEEVRGHLDALIDPSNVRVWTSLPQVAELHHADPWRRRAAERLREAFLLEQQPDVLLVTSLFEGLVDDAVTSLGLQTANVPTAVVLYDLIPLINRSPYLGNKVVEGWYERKLQHLRRADCLLAISESSRREALDHLGVSDTACVTISTAADPRFQPLHVPAQRAESLRRRHGLSRPFVMYTGGIDHRKNLEGLIRAFALLPLAQRSRHQLAIVCSVHESDRRRLTALAISSGLAPDELVLTGYVSDDDLLTLYNLCTLFVFPSWHEGFGLPALEAMACGRPVIAAATSSLPEVVGNKEALFDPHSDADMAGLMGRVLDDPATAEKLAKTGLIQSKSFSWDITAKRALAALEETAATKGRLCVPAAPRTRWPRPTLAFVGPVPPERTGIADYDAELVPALALHYDITIVTPQDEVTHPCVVANFPVRTPDWLVRHASSFDRVMYHMGNSHFHRHMFDLLRRVPGVVVLHDFYLGHLVEHMHGTGQWNGEHCISLHRSHGYSAVLDSLKPEVAQHVAWRYPTNLDIAQNALGMIVHSNAARALAAQWLGKKHAQTWHVVPQMRAPLPPIDQKTARETLGLPADEFVICSFGQIGASKLSLRLVEAFRRAAEMDGKGVTLLLVGANETGEYGAQVSRACAAPGRPGTARITGWVSDVEYRMHLAAADSAVQLRTQSRGETSRAILDCLSAGLSTIINRHGSAAEFGAEAVLAIPDEFIDDELVSALLRVRQDPELRRALSANGKRWANTHHQPQAVAAAYASALDTCYSSKKSGQSEFLRAFAAEPASAARGASDWLELSLSLAQNHAPSPRTRQLLVDVSVLAKVDAKTGIQRVVRAILLRWLEKPPTGFRVEPIMAADDGTYRYARRFTIRFLGGPEIGAGDPEVDAFPGDHLVMLDFQPNLLPSHLAAQRRLSARGVTVRYVVYDLLPVQMPDRFPTDTAVGHQAWLSATATADGVICISRAVADEYLDWLAIFGPVRSRDFAVDWFHLGSDIGASKPSRGVPKESESILARIGKQGGLLTVGTLEPRKRQDQVLAAMESLWSQGRKEVLVIVGKEGWDCATLAARLRAHRELGKRLFWFEQASDEWLDQLYSRCFGLVAASEGEGFGLSLAEARGHGLHLLVRDIAVFREVAGAEATFFSEKTGETLADCLEPWIDRTLDPTVPRPPRQAPLSWDDSATDLLACVLGERNYKTWRHNGVFRFLGHDPRIRTDVGRSNGRALVTTGREGFLCYGPFFDLASGRWRIELRGTAAGTLSGCQIDVVASGGSQVLWKAPLRFNDKPGEALWAHDLDVARPLEGFELRIFVKAAAQVTLERMELQRVD